MVRSAHTVFMCFVFIWEQTATCATYSINWLVFITEMKSVYSAVRIGSLNRDVWHSSLKGKIRQEIVAVRDQPPSCCVQLWFRPCGLSTNFPELLSDVPKTSVTLSQTGTWASNPNTAEKQEEGKEEKIRILFFFGSVGAKNKVVQFRAQSSRGKTEETYTKRSQNCQLSKIEHGTVQTRDLT